ncbi:MAG: CdaR family protein [Defluviitaleaceae bacterium]|nr:CdaR family protein [Defluviitaleaceae bacterium]MCL2276118.1 CdaR family protein [Defluviitaleaceae bacterium]
MSLIKKILAFFYTDLQWKLLAVGLSVILWLVSMAVLDPEQNRSYQSQLSLDNYAILYNENVVVLNDDIFSKQVIVGVRAPESYHNLQNEMLIRSSIDFRAVVGRDVHNATEPIELLLPVSVNLPYGFNLLHITPQEVTVVLDAHVRMTFPVEIAGIGAVGAGVELQSITPANNFVTLIGARSVIDQVVRVQVIAELHGLTESTTRIARLIAYDIEGNEMNDRLEFSVTETTLSIEVFPIQRALIMPEITGTLASGFAVADIFTIPDAVYIVGTADRLAQVEHIAPAFNLEGENENFERVIAIAEFLPEGIHLAQGEMLGAYLHVTVEPIREGTFTISRGNIGVFGYAQYTVLNDPSNVTIRASGAASVIAGLTANDITVHMNLRGLPIGTHRVPLQVILPAGIRLVGNPPALEVQIHEPAAPNGNNDEVEPPIYVPDPDLPPDIPDPVEPDDPPDILDPVEPDENIVEDDLPPEDE